MARLPEGRQRLYPGVSYTMQPGRGLSINLKLRITWYGFMLLAWKKAHEEYNIKWYQYPRLCLLILRRGFLFAVKRGEKNG